MEKYAHRPVNAEGYMFIHCLFVGFKKEFKGKGYASSLIDECNKDAKMTVIRSAQCPYSVKNVDAILKKYLVPSVHSALFIIKKLYRIIQSAIQDLKI